MKSTQPSFKTVSYLRQLRMLRALAGEALKRYRLTAVEIKLINHGENTTYRITAADKKKYLLRIHRDDYHSTAALGEELRWLAFLAADGALTIPSPVRSKQGKILETASTADVGTRHVCLFKWIEGRFIDTAVTERKMFKLGQLVGQLQGRVPRGKVKHRRYWSADGLLGNPTTFGSLDKLKGIAPDPQKKISRYRRLVLGKLRRYEKQFPRRMGLIHADLHFGNLLWLEQGEFGAIDFDDCGYGFHAYDLVMPIISMEVALGKRRVKHGPPLRRALLDGYRSVKKFDRHDEAILPHLISARRLMMLGWISSRSDNARLAKLLKPRVRRVLKHLDKEYGG